MLYGLVAGHPPLPPAELVQAGDDEMRRNICEADPPPPSRAIANELNPNRLPSPRNPSPERLAAVQGDLDWVVMMCLEKNRSRSYENKTANGLAAELRCHLNYEPVLASPPSAPYRFREAWRRHKLPFAFREIVVLVLLVGVSALALVVVRERALKSKSARADSITQFVIGLLYKAGPVAPDGGGPELPMVGHQSPLLGRPIRLPSGGGWRSAACLRGAD